MLTTWPPATGCFFGLTIDLYCVPFGLYTVNVQSGFSQKDKIGKMPILASEALLPEKNVIPSGNRTWASHNLWFQVQYYPFYTNLTFACKTDTLGSLFSHALLIPLKSFKSKYQVVHEQKFKVLSSTYQFSVERIVLDLESEVMRGQGSIHTVR